MNRYFFSSLLVLVVSLLIFIGIPNARINADENDSVYREKTETVQYNWGNGSPSPSIPVDNFTAIFDQTRIFEPGNYFIQTLADDGVKVEADGKWLIDRWGANTNEVDRA
ncbi:PA14 domain-containing protein, partial [Niallia hominis]